MRNTGSGDGSAALIGRDGRGDHGVRGHFAEFGIVAPQGIRRVGEFATLLIDESATTLARQALRALLGVMTALAKGERLSRAGLPLCARQGLRSITITCGAILTGRFPRVAAALFPVP